MERLRRLVLLVALLGVLAGVSILLNFTPLNPTHRRYSSETPLTTGQGSANQLGDTAERILSIDLRLPNNNDPSQLQCLCSRASDKNGRKCRSCLLVSSDLVTFRLPDFVGNNWIADSKNVQILTTTDQLRDYLVAAQALKWAVWIYVRVDTQVDEPLETQVRSTGGGIVRYFTVPGYADPLDASARQILVVSIAALGLLLLVEFRTWRLGGHFWGGVPASPSQPRRPVDPSGKAARSTDTAEDFLRKSRDRHRTQIDEEDSRDDF